MHRSPRPWISCDLSGARARDREPDARHPRRRFRHPRRLGRAGRRIGHPLRDVSIFRRKRRSRMSLIKRVPGFRAWALPLSQACKCWQVMDCARGLCRRKLRRGPPPGSTRPASRGDDSVHAFPRSLPGSGCLYLAADRRSAIMVRDRTALACGGSSMSEPVTMLENRSMAIGADVIVEHLASLCRQQTYPAPRPDRFAVSRMQNGSPRLPSSRAFNGCSPPPTSHS